MPRVPPKPPISDSFPISLQEFLGTLVGTPDEVWSALMRQHFTGKNMRASEWTKKLESLKG